MDLRDIKEFIKDALKYVVTVFVVIFVIVYVVTLQQVIGPSMQTTLNDQDIVILSKIHYKIFKIKRFDVIALKYADTKYLIKRVIGMPGDKIEYKNGILYVNGTAIKESFLDKRVTTDDFSLEKLGYDRIPDNMYLVLGDNRKNSLDSRSKKVGLIKKNDIIGRVNIRIWPVNKLKLVK